MSVISETTAESEKLRLHYIDLYTKKSQKRFGFYRPHDPKLGAFDNTDPKTGEVYPSMTRQSEMEACDLHNILRQFSSQGFDQLVRENAARGQYADLPDDIDYQMSLNLVMAAQASFATLPSQVRERFKNDPARFLQFVGDPANQDELIRLGIAEDTRPVEPPPQKVEIVNTPPPEPDKGNRG